MTLPLSNRPQAERHIEECFVYLAEGNFDLGINFPRLATQLFTVDS